MPAETIKWVNNRAKIIDQRKLPGKFEFVYCKDVQAMWRAIKTLTVRGAPAIGVAAALGVLLGIKGFKEKNRAAFERHFNKICDYIGTSRPTAVNLFNAVVRMKQVVKDNPKASVSELQKLLKKEAFQIFEDDRRACRQMGNFGAGLIKDGSQIMTICNAGALATVDYGTALGVMYAAKNHGKKFSVFVLETRPLLQGSRLTAWELLKEKIDTTLICDNMAATLMKQNKVDAIFTGADRIASNGDAANKIGTYNLAVLAKHHNIPFYIVAPKSSFDLKIKSGKEIPIEERKSDEITHVGNRAIAPPGVKVYNPAFDVTDHQLITAIITERGIIRPPFGKNIKKIFV